jgi:TolB-like protein/cytochrome c-type biogenesis protein CcmH/NrfG
LTRAGTPPASLPDKPSIAVLPFQNMSGDPDQEYFADGLAEDIITGLSKFHWFFVIARNSSFAYKRSSVDVKQIAQELGVQYVLEGSVRKAANRVRVTAQLIDALTGRHVWADRYDRDLEDIFAVQDEVTEAIVGAVAPSFITAESKRVERKPPESFDAWDYAMRGNWHLSQRTRSDAAEACRLFERALELDGRSTMALSGYAFALGWTIFFGWADDLAETRSLIHTAARRAVAVDEKDAGAHVALGFSSFYMHDLDSAVSSCRRALELNPNFALAEAWLANALSWRGDHEEALVHADKAVRLSPHDPIHSWSGLAKMSAEFGAGHYEQSVEWARKAIEITPEFPAAWRYIAAGLAHLGELEQAPVAKDRLLAVSPHENLRLVRAALPSLNRDRIDRFVDGLRKAGVPE